MTKYFLMATVSVLSLSTLISGVAQAEIIILDTVTVSGTRTEKTVFENPKSISVITSEEIEKKSTESIAELLRDVPGVQILDDSVAGMKRIVIRGEDSRRNVIMIDGQEITDHTTYGAPLLIDPSSVERIEVVKGPSSVLHGTKAIGGVINIITKKGGSKPIETIISTTYSSATRGFQGSATVLGSLKNWDYRFTVSGAEHGNRRSAEGTLPDSKFSNDVLSAHLGYRAGNHYFAFKAEQYKLVSDGYVASTPSSALTFDLNLPQRDRSKIAFFYDGTDLTPWLKKVHFDAYHQIIDRVFTTNATFAPVAAPTVPGPPAGPAPTLLDFKSVDTAKTTGATIQFDTKPLPNHELIFGSQYLDDRLDALKTTDIMMTMVSFGGGLTSFPVSSTPEFDASVKTLSVFAQDEWSIGNNVKVTGGARFYHINAKEKNNGFSNSDNKVVGSLGLTYSGIQNTTLRVLGSQGYVYPTILQMFIDSSASGTTINANQSLKPETSNNIEIGARHNSNGFVFDASAFYTSAKDYITGVNCAAASAPCGAPVGSSDEVWENVSKATSFGLEMFAEYKTGLTGNLTPYANATMLRRKFNYTTLSTFKTNTPLLRGRAGVKFDWEVNDLVSGWGDVYMRGATKAVMEDETGAVSREKGWTTLNLSLGVDVGEDKNMQFLVNFNNITNKRYTPANEIPGAGRSVELTSRIKF